MFVGQPPTVGDAAARGGNSKVDILICTPGRLMDHLKATQGFSLQHLRFLVIDEADRLLNQSFNDWLKTVLSRIELGASSSLSLDGLEDNAESVPIRPDALAPAVLQRMARVLANDVNVKLKPSASTIHGCRSISPLTCARRLKSCSSPQLSLEIPVESQPCISTTRSTLL